MDISQLFSTMVDSFSTAAIAIYTCAIVLYFIAEYKTKSNDSNFSLGYWIKDNWINVLASAALFVLYNFAYELIRVKDIFMIAFGANYLIDVLITWRARVVKK